MTALIQGLTDITKGKQTLQAAASVLESSLQRLESQLHSERALTQQEKDRAELAEALLVSVREQLADAVKERDNQMNALAKVIRTSTPTRPPSQPTLSTHLIPLLQVLSSTATGPSPSPSVDAEQQLEAAKAETAQLAERCTQVLVVDPP